MLSMDAGGKQDTCNTIITCNNNWFGFVTLESLKQK